MNWKRFLEGLAVTAIGGATTGAAHAATEGVVNPKAIGTSAAIGALIAVGAWVKQSPIEPRQRRTRKDQKEQ